MVQLKNKANETEFHFSRNDIEKLYNLLCFEELEAQDRDIAKYNPSRSWSALKKALNVWFHKKLGIHREKIYTIIVNDLLKEDSYLKQVIHKALVGFREEYSLKLKDTDGKEFLSVALPQKELGFTDDFEELEVSKNVYNKFYSRKKYLGKENEEQFINFLETQKNIVWWHKQTDSGKDNFAVEYFDTQEKKDRLFYPDFIISTADNKIYLVDTKKDATAKSTETKDKAQALQKWIKANQEKYDFKIIGGIVIFQHPNWMLNSKEIYSYENSDEWDSFFE